MLSRANHVARALVYWFVDFVFASLQTLHYMYLVGKALKDCWYMDNGITATALIIILITSSAYFL